MALVNLGPFKFGSIHHTGGTQTVCEEIGGRYYNDDGPYCEAEAKWRVLSDITAIGTECTVIKSKCGNVGGHSIGNCFCVVDDTVTSHVKMAKSECEAKGGTDIGNGDLCLVEENYVLTNLRPFKWSTTLYTGSTESMCGEIGGRYYYDDGPWCEAKAKWRVLGPVAGSTGDAATSCLRLSSECGQVGGHVIGTCFCVVDDTVISHTSMATSECEEKGGKDIGSKLCLVKQTSSPTQAPSQASTSAPPAGTSSNPPANTSGGSVMFSGFAVLLALVLALSV